MKIEVGVKFNYSNHNNSKTEVIEIVAMRGEGFVFESLYTPGMTIPLAKVKDLMSRGKLTLLNNCPVSDSFRA